MPTFGERFRKLRKEKNMTQNELAEDFNRKHHYQFTKSSISQYENNKRKPEIYVLEEWANYFNVSIDYLLRKTDIRNYDNLEWYSNLPDELKELVREENIEHMEVAKDLKDRKLGKEYMDKLRKFIQTLKPFLDDVE